MAACWSELGATQHPASCVPLRLPQVLFAWELQRRTGGQVVSVAVHPGGCGSWGEHLPPSV